MRKVKKLRRFKRRRHSLCQPKRLVVTFPSYSPEKIERLRRGLDYLLPKLSFGTEVADDV